MGVDAGIPDFRGKGGIWGADGPFGKFGMTAEDMSNPRWYREEPAFIWGHHVVMRRMFRDCSPHAGYHLLQEWARARPAGYHVYTSNVDNHFQRAGFDPERVFECHGSFDYMQCAGPCTTEIWHRSEAVGPDIDDMSVDPDTLRAHEPLPSCPRCGGVARPNVVLFVDEGWLSGRLQERVKRYLEWVKSVANRRLCIVEIGAGVVIDTVRRECESRRGTLIRINPSAPEVPDGGLSIARPALEALQLIAEHMS